MDENRKEYKESIGHNGDLYVINPHSGRKGKIKQEILVDYSSKPPPPVPKTEDSWGSSSLKVKVKQEPSSKLSELKRSLELNKKISSLLEAEIWTVKLAHEKNLEKQASLQKILDEDKAKVDDKPSRIRVRSLFAAPYFRDLKQMVPPNNEDTKVKLQNQDINAYVKPPRPWTNEENKKLLDGVTGYALFSALKPYKIERERLKKKLKDQDLSESKAEVIEKQLSAIEKRIKSDSEKPLTELLKEVEGKIDWMNISAADMEGKRTADECENMWNNFLNFTINKEAFTFEEDERLKNIVEDHNERDWDTIATLLKTNRTAIQCFERYQTRLNTNHRRRFWTPEEHKKLTELVAQHRYGEIIHWDKITLLMEGRTQQQVIDRYKRTISQVNNQGPWMPEEDAMLIACYHKYGSHWAKMKVFFQRRSPEAIRERYINSLDPSIKMGFWTKEEDRLFVTMIQRYGYGKWSEICKHIPGRTDHVCLKRAGLLLEHAVRYHSDKGTGEYDPGVNDPELFARIVRPHAKEYTFPNRIFKDVREDAIEKLSSAIKKVMPEFEGDGKNIDSAYFSRLSYELLQRISDELHRMLEERLQGLEPYVPRARYFTKPPLIRKRLYESEEEIPELSPEKRLPKEERMWVDSVLNTLIQMLCKIVCPYKKGLGQVYTSRETAEISLYKAYLYKQFHCLAKCDEDDDIENVTFSGANFSETSQRVVSYFIQPPIYEGQFIVLAPNMTTIGGMEVVEITENRLQTMSKYVSHSKNYLDFICERRKSCPKCLQCLHREQQISSPSISIEEMTLNMEKDLFVVDGPLKEAVNVESTLLNTSKDTCSCCRLLESRKSVQLLRKRFMSLFLWPALLSATVINKEQETILCTRRERTDLRKNYFWQVNGSKREGKIKRRRRKEVDKSFRISQRALRSDQNEPEPSTSGLDTENLHLSDITADKIMQKLKTEKNQEHPEGLRRSKRLCVRNRTSISYPEINSKQSWSTDESENCLAIPTVLEDQMES